MCKRARVEDWKGVKGAEVEANVYVCEYGTRIIHVRIHLKRV